MAAPAAAAPAEELPPGVVKQGWLYREEFAQGSMSTWKKRWHVLTNQKLLCYKHDRATEPITTMSVASIEEMAYGKIADKSWSFSLTTPRGIVKMSAEAEQVREDWVKTLRQLVPKAKVELAKEMLMRKAKRKANLEMAQQQIKEAIESILRDAKRLAVFEGFKAYADQLADSLQQMVLAVDLVGDSGLSSAKQCAICVTASVDAANSASAICTNKAIQTEIISRMREICLETANLLGYATTSGSDKAAKQHLSDCQRLIKEKIRQLLELLISSGALQQELDDSLLMIDQALQGPAPGMVKSTAAIESSIDDLSERAKVLQTVMKNIATNAIVQPERVGEYSKEAAVLMCELLDATNFVASSNGYDGANIDYLVSSGQISEAKKQQIESLLAAAKGFAAATTNMIDLLKQVPQQSDDESLQFRLSVATRSADNALNAFRVATDTVDTGAAGAPAGSSLADFDDPYAPAPTRGDLDAEQELINALDSIEQSLVRLQVSETPALHKTGVNNKAIQNLQESGQPESLVEAAKLMGAATASLLTAAAAAQREIKQEPGGNPYRKDPNWARGLVAAAQSVAETTNQLVDVAADPNSTPEDIVAAARCANGATARLMAFSTAKGDPNSDAHRQLETASRSVTQATNALVNAAKAQKTAESDLKTDAEIKQLREAPRTKQIRSEFEAQARIARLEVELDEARQYLFKIRRAVYGRDADAEYEVAKMNRQPPKPVKAQAPVAKAPIVAIVEEATRLDKSKQMPPVRASVAPASPSSVPASSRPLPQTRGPAAANKPAGSAPAGRAPAPTRPAPAASAAPAAARPLPTASAAPAQARPAAPNSPSPVPSRPPPAKPAPVEESSRPLGGAPPVKAAPPLPRKPTGGPPPVPR